MKNKGLGYSVKVEMYEHGECYDEPNCPIEDMQCANGRYGADADESAWAIGSLPDACATDEGIIWYEWLNSGKIKKIYDEMSVKHKFYERNFEHQPIVFWHFILEGGPKHIDPDCYHIIVIYPKPVTQCLTLPGICHVQSMAKPLP
jgi:hypothetical protein